MGTALELSDSLYSFCDFLGPFDPLVVNHIKHVLLMVRGDMQLQAKFIIEFADVLKY